MSLSVENETEENINTEKKDGSEMISTCPKKKITIREENNNEINILATNFDEMGNITDKCKDTLERCGSPDFGNFNYATGTSLELKSERMKKDKKNNDYDIQDCDDYDYESDEFEEDGGDDEFEDDTQNITIATVHYTDNGRRSRMVASSRSRNDERKEEITKRNSEDRRSIDKFEDAKKHFTRDLILTRNVSSSSTSLSASKRGQSRRLNMSFTNERAREIHRENHILMKKLLKTQSTRTSSSSISALPRESSSAITRRKREEKRDHENLILLRKIQAAKSSNLSFRR